MTITWPNLLHPSRQSVELRNFVRSGPPTATGRQQRVFSDAGFWTIYLELPLLSPEHVRGWRAVIARLRQGEDILVRIFEQNGPHGIDESASSAKMAASADLRATSISVDVTGIIVEPGSYLTISGRLHMVTAVTSEPSIPPGLGPWQVDSPWNDSRPWIYGEAPNGVYEIDIIPPLRAVAADGQAVSFRNLLVRCVLADMGDGDVVEVSDVPGRPSLTFIESI